MADHVRYLINPEKLPGGKPMVLPVCGPDTDAAYEAAGWVDAPEGTEVRDVIGDMIAESEAANATDAPAGKPADQPEPSTVPEPVAAPDWGTATDTGEQTDTEHQEP